MRAWRSCAAVFEIQNYTSILLYVLSLLTLHCCCTAVRCSCIILSRNIRNFLLLSSSKKMFIFMDRVVPLTPLTFLFFLFELQKTAVRSGICVLLFLGFEFEMFLGQNTSLKCFFRACILRFYLIMVCGLRGGAQGGPTRGSRAASPPGVPAGCVTPPVRAARLTKICACCTQHNSSAPGLSQV